MADSTAITFSCNPLQELLALDGINMEVGGTILQYAPINNTDVTYKGTLGWRNWGLLETPAKFAQTLTFLRVKLDKLVKL